MSSAPTPTSASASASSATPIPPRRQSCDRCHSQKLRCTRAGNSSMGACDRCQRQGAKCAYSPALPKGRPSIYRSLKTATAPSSAPMVEPAMDTDADALATGGAGGAIAIDDVVGNNSNGSSSSSCSGTDDGMMRADPPDSWTWSWAAPVDWNHLAMDGTGSEPDLTLPDAGAPFLEAFPSLLGWASAGAGIEELNADVFVRAGPPSPIRLHENGFGPLGELFTGNSFATTIPINKMGIEDSIAHLSQLSTRLYPLHRSSSTLAGAADSSRQSSDRNQGRRGPLLDVAAFKSVATWLLQVSANVNMGPSRGIGQDIPPEAATTGETLQGAFSASHRLLEILESLQGDPVLGSSNSDFWGNNTPLSTTSNSGGSYFDQSPGASGYARPPSSSQHSDTVVRHLVTACHTLLLNIYLGLLVVLQHDADLPKTGHPMGSGDADTSMDPTALADIRLVLVVQLCSYLIGRLQQAVDAYTSPPATSPASQPRSSFSSNHQPNVAGLATSNPNKEVFSDLEVEVRKRLTRLRQSLRL